jgi:peptidyl-prolyl cis-trans isomerase B (cyclophilin B)
MKIIRKHFQPFHCRPCLIIIFIVKFPLVFARDFREEYIKGVKSVKKAILVIMSVVLIFTMAACAPGNGKNITIDQNGGLNMKVEKNPVVTITMDDGSKINIELYPDKAPNTVCNFISLIKKQVYDGVTFHRIIDNFMIQGGDPDGTGFGGPGYFIKGEFAVNGFKQNDLKHSKGVLSMARAGQYNTAGSQFFIMVADNSSLDGLYAAFGKVADEDSLSVVLKLAKLPTSGPPNDKPNNPPKMKTVTVDTFGYNYPEPQTIKK